MDWLRGTISTLQTTLIFAKDLLTGNVVTINTERHDNYNSPLSEVDSPPEIKITSESIKESQIDNTANDKSLVYRNQNPHTSSINHSMLMTIVNPASPNAAIKLVIDTTTVRRLADSLMALPPSSEILQLPVMHDLIATTYKKPKLAIEGHAQETNTLMPSSNSYEVVHKYSSPKLDSNGMYSLVIPARHLEFFISQLGKLDEKLQIEAGKQSNRQVYELENKATSTPTISQKPTIKSRKRSYSQIANDEPQEENIKQPRSSETAKETTNKTIEKPKSRWEKFVNFCKKAAKSIESFFKHAFAFIKTVEKTAEKVSKTAEQVSNTISNAKKEAHAQASNIEKEVKDLPKNVKEAARSSGLNIASTITNPNLAARKSHAQIEIQRSNIAKSRRRHIAG